MESKRNNSSVRVLLVDDDEDDFILTRDLLAEIPDSQFQLDWVADYDQALATICRHEHDLCLLDYRLGRSTGLNLIREATARGSTAPVILLTGQSEREIDFEAMRAGAADFLEKSRLDAALLERSIRYTLQQKCHADELERKVQERTAELARANAALQAEVAERGRVEEVLREVNRRKDEFLATLAHELRNPLVPIRNAVEIMRLSENTPEVVGAHRAMIERQVKHLVRLLDDLLDIARISRGRIQLRKEKFDVAAAIQSAVESCQSLLTAAGHQLTIDLRPDPIFIEADPTRIAQILCNLLNNAVKYTPPGGEIRLTVTHDESNVVFRLRDNGIGISSDLIPHIFELFTRGTSSPDQTQGGLGVGLSLAQSLLKLHGGTIEAHSEGDGKGSEFVIRLPRSHDHDVTESVDTKNGERAKQRA